MDKKAIRSKVIKSLNELNFNERELKSKQIIEKLISTENFKNANTIATTMPMEHEINTKLLIQASWNLKKSVVVPKCIHKTKEMKFYQITSFTELEKGYFGLQEPKEALCELIDREKIDLIIVPGVAYTKKGERLGYGGGYYDRYLENYSGDILALAFNLQIIEQLPTEAHDIILPLIVTETEIIHAK